MSSFEYIDMFDACQKNGIYHMFAFDLKDSKSMDALTLIRAESELKRVVIDLYNELQRLEYKTGIKILLEKEIVENEYSMRQEPYLFGDAICITIYRDSIDNESFFELFNKIKEKHDFKYKLHIADGYYETVKWEEGDKKFARSYCFDILSNKHKSKQKIKRNNNI